MPSNHLILLSSPSPPAFNLSQHQGLSNESVLCIRWPKYWSFSFSISPSNEHPGLISFRMDWWSLFSSVAQSCLILCDFMDCSTTGFPVHQQLSELTQTHVHRVGNAIQPSHLLSSPSPPVFSLSQHQGLSNESVLHMRWPKCWSFSFSNSPSNEHSELIFFRMDWLDPLAVQGILKNLLQHHSSKASILLCSAFFTVQLSHPYMTTGKTIALTRRTFVGNVSAF